MGCGIALVSAINAAARARMRHGARTAYAQCAVHDTRAALLQDARARAASRVAFNAARPR